MGKPQFHLKPKITEVSCPGGAHPYIHLSFTLIIDSILHLTFPFSSSWNDHGDGILCTSMHAHFFTPPIAQLQKDDTEIFLVKG